MDPFNNRLFRIHREALMVDNVFMEIVSEKVATSCSSMSIVDCEKGGLDSIFVDVQNDADSVFIVVSGDSLVSVDCIRLYMAILFG